MLRILLKKIWKGIKLLYKIVKAQFSFYLSLLLFIVLFLPIIHISQNLYVNLLASLFVTFVLLIFDTAITYRKFSKLEGEYDSYLYDTEDIKKLKTETDGVYEVSYEGGYQISIKKTKSLETGREDYLWKGEAEISDVRIGTLYWKYISPEALKDYVGYKKIIIPRTNSKEIKIFLFGEDKLITQREVLIKRTV